MCFSEKVSFAAAGALTVMAFICFYTVRREKQKYALAAIPFFFALQQAAEGVEWLYFKDLWGTQANADSARDLFAFIAHAVWPFWIPFSLWLAEPEAKNRRWLEIMLLFGALLSLYFGYHVIAHPVEAHVVNQSIFYEINVNKQLVWPYSVLIIVPWWISSLPWTKFLGTVFFLATLLSFYFYTETFTSVWCFAAALMSLTLIFVLRESRTAPKVNF